jgi:hypothetical protein
MASVPSYEEEIRPIFEKNCVSCHSCYDAPCQLNLTDPEGWQRGMTAAPVYGVLRLKDAQPTRLFEDGHSEADWRELGFSPVIGTNAESSLLWSAVALGTEHPLPAGEPPPAAIDLSLGADQVCPTHSEYPEFAAEHPLLGMPYGMSRLSADELTTLHAWLEAGAPVDTVRDTPGAIELAEVSRWESFLNEDGDREQLVARYLYEHLYLAKLSFEEDPSGNTFRLVRSSTPPGEPVVELTTRLPNDPPTADLDTPYFYRFERVRGTRVRKNHLPLVLSQSYLERLNELFLVPEWETTPGRAHNWEDAQNPFVAFVDIPQQARYQFLLDHSWFFLSNFIRGPVCRGPIALGVIRDRFYVAFLDPEADLPEDFVEASKELLYLPGSVRGLGDYIMTVRRFSRRQRKYLRHKGRELAEQIPEGRTLDDVWTGDPNARLTIFRHRDSATVVRDWVGTEPETVWVMDYTTLERTYYSLVVNFDVFGTATHQTATRQHFDYIRAESEDAFLLFMPRDERRHLRSEWDRGLLAKRKQARQYRFSGRRLPTAVGYETDAPKTEWLGLLGGFGAMSLPEDASVIQAHVEEHLRLVELYPQPQAQQFSEMTVIHVVVDGSIDNDLVYSITRDRAHRNTAFMLRENARLEPERDGLTAVPGVLGDYPNRIFRVPADDVDLFFTALQEVGDAATYRALIDRWGMYRTSPILFDEVEWLYYYDQARNPVTAGRLDLYRYGGELPE